MNYLLVTFLIAFVFINNGSSHIVKKRQIFREQVLPHQGGKVPDHAFETDRLALNRLQKEGIAVPDGILLEQRAHQVFPHPNKAYRPTFRVVKTPDGRYTPEEGKYHHHSQPSIDTTYTIPQIWNHPINLPLMPYLPVYKPLRLPNHIYIGNGIEAFDSKVKDSSKIIYGNPMKVETDGWHPIPPPQQSVIWTSQSLPTSYANQWAQFDSSPIKYAPVSNHLTTQFGGDFESFFNNYNSRIARNIRKATANAQSKQKVPVFKKLS